MPHRNSSSIPCALPAPLLYKDYNGERKKKQAYPIAADGLIIFRHSGGAAYDGITPRALISAKQKKRGVSPLGKKRGHRQLSAYHYLRADVRVRGDTARLGVPASIDGGG